jgi:hypothetical protein
MMRACIVACDGNANAGAVLWALDYLEQRTIYERGVDSADVNSRPVGPLSTETALRL